MVKKAFRSMQPLIKYNDAWEMISLDGVDDVIDFFKRNLQPSHPLKAYKLFPIAKCWRKYKYLVEEEVSSDFLWVLDMDRKVRIHGKTCFYFKRMETQEELDALLKADLESWVQQMKDMGAWHQ